MPEIHIFLKLFLTMAKAVHEIQASGEKTGCKTIGKRIVGGLDILPTSQRG